MHPLAAGETVCPECGRAYGCANAETFALKPGTILEGKYLVGEMLGQGGFGITYIGFDLLLEQKVAIKEYYPMSTGMVSREGHSTVVWSSAMMGKTGTQKGFDSFLKEARKMAKLGGIPGVVGVKSVFIQNETAYIVMDFIEGETLLKKLQKNGPMDFDSCVKLMTPIMQALAEVHEHGIIHRDISPDNIMVRPDGKLILLDLGAAKDLDIQGNDGSVQSSQMVAKHGFSPIEAVQQERKGRSVDGHLRHGRHHLLLLHRHSPAPRDRPHHRRYACLPAAADAGAVRHSGGLYAYAPAGSSAEHGHAPANAHPPAGGGEIVRGGVGDRTGRTGSKGASPAQTDGDRTGSPEDPTDKPGSAAHPTAPARCGAEATAFQMADPRRCGGGRGDSPRHFHRQRREKIQPLRESPGCADRRHGTGAD